MSFWGLNQSGKDSKGFVREYGDWNFGQYKDWLNKSNNSQDTGNYRTGEAYDYWKNRAGTGLGSTGDVRSYGEAAMPGLQDAINKRRALLEQQQQNLQNFGYRAPQTMDQINSTLDTMGGNVGQNWDFTQGVIDQGYAGMTGRANAANQELVQNIKDTYGSGRGQFNDAYGQLRGNAAGVYRGLEGALNENTTAQQKNLELLNPASEASAARAARSYAPLMSNTMSRLRRGGVDPNSAQAGGMLAQAEAERARGIDDAAATGAEKYALASNNVLANKQAGLERLRGAGLAADTALGTNQAGTNLQLGLDEGGAFQDEVRRNLGLQTALDQTRQGQTLDNQQFNFLQGQNVLGQRADAAQLGRQFGLQDLGLDQSMLDKAMTEEMVGPEAYAAQFGLGQNYATANTAAQNAGASGMTSIGQADLARAIQQAMAAQGFGDDAIRAHLQNLGIQSANAGWGSKLLAGLGAAGLNMVAPGTGTAVMSAVR